MFSAYLNDEPVVACPPSAIYQFRKFARRNKAALVVSSTIAIFLTVGIIGLVISNHWLGESQKETQAALETADKNLRLAHVNEKKAEDNFRRAQAAVDDYLTKVSEETLDGTPATEPLRKELLELAAKYYEEFAEEYVDDASLSSELAAAHIKLGSIYDSMGYFEKTAASRRQAVQILSRLVEQNPEDQEFRSMLADAYHHLGQRTESDEGREFLQKAFEMRSVLADEHPSNREYQESLAQSCYDMARIQSDVYRRFDYALELFEQGIAIRKELQTSNPELHDNQIYLAYLTYFYANLQSKMNNRDSLVSIDEAIRLFSLNLEQKEDSGIRMCLGEAFIIKARAIWKHQQRDKAISANENAIQILKELAIQCPDVLRNIESLVLAFETKVSFQMQLRNPTGLAAAQREAIDFFKARAAQYDFNSGDLVAVNRLSHLAVASKKFYDSLRLYAKFPLLEEVGDFRLRIGRDLVAASPENLSYQKTLLETLRFQANVFLQKREFGPSSVFFDEAIELSKKLMAQEPNLDTRLQSAMTHGHFADLLLEQKKYDGVLKHSKIAFEISQSLLEGDPHKFQFVADITRWHSQLFESLNAKGRFDEAEQYSQKLEEILTKAADADTSGNTRSAMPWAIVLFRTPSPTLIEFANKRAEEIVRSRPDSYQAWMILGGALYRGGNYAKARECLEKAKSLRSPLSKDPEELLLLAMTHWQLDDRQQAHDVYLQALDVMWPGNGTWSTGKLQMEAAELLEIGEDSSEVNEDRVD